ncbi:MAG: hypothetical protein IK050_06270 [Lachnospiraceae bacterium]|nr:hypothetical protein [Lachnospiraceae bacterium]
MDKRRLVVAVVSIFVILGLIYWFQCINRIPINSDIEAIDRIIAYRTKKGGKTIEGERILLPEDKWEDFFILINKIRVKKTDYIESGESDYGFTIIYKNGTKTEVDISTEYVREIDVWEMTKTPYRIIWYSPGKLDSLFEQE